MFWYDIDFNEDPYQPQKRFDDNFDRTDGSGGQTSQQRPRSADERQPRGVRAEYDFREPRQKFGGDTQGAQSSRRRSGGEEPARPARGTPEASWKPAAKRHSWPPRQRPTSLSKRPFSTRMLLPGDTEEGGGGRVPRLA